MSAKSWQEQLDAIPPFLLTTEEKEKAEAIILRLPCGSNDRLALFRGDQVAAWKRIKALLRPDSTGLASQLEELTVTNVYKASFVIIDAPYHCDQLMKLAQEHHLGGCMRYLEKWRFKFEVYHVSTSPSFLASFVDIAGTMSKTPRFKAVEKDAEIIDVTPVLLVGKVPIEASAFMPIFPNVQLAADFRQDVKTCVGSLLGYTSDSEVGGARSSSSQGEE